VQKVGNVLVIDHYVQTPQQLVEDVRSMREATGADIVLGEYGAPIPDIHGDLSSSEQAKLIEDNLKAIAGERSYVRGINYWTALGGSTRIFDDIKEPRDAVSVLTTYYTPLKVTGKVTDTIGTPINHATINIAPYGAINTDALGRFQALTTPDELQATIEKDGYKRQKADLEIGEDGQINVRVALEPQKRGVLYRLKLWFSNVLGLLT